MFEDLKAEREKVNGQYNCERKRARLSMLHIRIIAKGLPFSRIKLMTDSAYN